LYLGECPPEGLPDFSEELQGLHSRYKTFILWGERTELKDEWLEQQIPQRIRYPLQTKEYNRGRVVLTIEQWVDDYGIPRFSRYMGINETANSSQQEARGDHAAG